MPVWLALLEAEVRRVAGQQAGASADGDGDGDADGDTTSGAGGQAAPARGGALPPSRVRRFFEQALEVPVGGGVVLLWRWYLRFELACGNPLGAKKVFLRAINRCVPLRGASRALCSFPCCCQSCGGRWVSGR